MDIDHPDRDQSWDHDARGETETERLDRNWANLLQELRVVQTGVQLLTGFLLTLPFQEQFMERPGRVKVVYLATVLCSIGATILLVAPVGMHRILFRRHELRALVSAAHRLAIAGLLLLGFALVGVVDLIFDTVAGEVTGVIVACGTALAFLIFWVFVPLGRRLRHDDV